MFKKALGLYTTSYTGLKGKMTGRSKVSTAEYNKVAGQCITEQVCKSGELRLGVFFDGTGNDDKNPVEFSNVKKLFDVYPNNITTGELKPPNPDKNYPCIQSAYIRGVGTRSDSFTGGAMGTGGFDRIDGMMYLLEAAIENHKNDSKDNFLPKHIVLDVFGFSRGAILARHFVNVIKQGFYQLRGTFSDYEPNDFTVRTLNIFDSVSSFNTVYIPGQPRDPGWAYNVDKNMMVQQTIHFMADDEYRIHFDGQTVSSGQNLDYPKDIDSNLFKELVFMGAHSDIGGGYRPRHHGRSSNDLGKLYLNEMYNLAKENAVPFLDKPKNRVDWTVPQPLFDLFNEIKIAYDIYPKLKVAHKKFRERMGYLYDANDPKAPAWLLPGKLNANINANNKQMNALWAERNKIMKKSRAKQTAELSKNGKAYNDLRVADKSCKAQLEEYTKLQHAFENPGLPSARNVPHQAAYQAFIETAIEFHNTYVHQSHSAAFQADYDGQGKATGGDREMMGMSAEVDDKALHRHWYYQEPIDVIKELQEQEESLKPGLFFVLFPIRHVLKPIKYDNFGFHRAIARKLED